MIAQRMWGLSLAALLLAGLAQPTPAPRPTLSSSYQAEGAADDGFIAAVADDAVAALPDPELAEVSEPGKLYDPLVQLTPTPSVPHRWNAQDVQAALQTASPRARCIVTAEIGGFGFDPWVRGVQGERGPAQLHPNGLLRDFHQRGYSEPENPWQAVEYLETALREGMARHWSPVLRGLC